MYYMYVSIFFLSQNEMSAMIFISRKKTHNNNNIF